MTGHLPSVSTLTSPVEGCDCSVLSGFPLVVTRLCAVNLFDAGKTPATTSAAAARPHDNDRHVMDQFLSSILVIQWDFRRWPANVTMLVSPSSIHNANAFTN
jgi:hypothetical protein